MYTRKSVVPECCGNCGFWKKLEGEMEPWGICGAGKSKNLLRRYIRPVPKKLETIAMFYCPVFLPSEEAIKAEAAKGSGQ